MFFEDLPVGLTLRTLTRLVTASDVDAFVELTGLKNPIFESDAGAQIAGHAARLTPGPMLLALAMGLAQQTGLFDHVVAVLQFDAVRFLGTVHPGDAITLDVEVVAQRKTRRPDRGLVELDYVLTTQRGQKVMVAHATYLMRTRAA